MNTQKRIKNEKREVQKTKSPMKTFLPGPSVEPSNIEGHFVGLSYMYSAPSQIYIPVPLFNREMCC